MHICTLWEIVQEWIQQIVLTDDVVVYSIHDKEKVQRLKIRKHYPFVDMIHAYIRTSATIQYFTQFKTKSAKHFGAPPSTAISESITNEMGSTSASSCSQGRFGAEIWKPSWHMLAPLRAKTIAPHVC